MEVVKVKELMDYGFYDDNGRYIIKISKEKLKQIFKADDIIFEEIYK